MDPAILSALIAAGVSVVTTILHRLVLSSSPPAGPAVAPVDKPGSAPAPTVISHPILDTLDQFLRILVQRLVPTNPSNK